MADYWDLAIFSLNKRLSPKAARNLTPRLYCRVYTRVRECPRSWFFGRLSEKLPFLSEICAFLSEIWPIACPRFGRFPVRGTANSTVWDSVNSKGTFFVCGCVVCRQKGHNEQPSVPCLSVFYPRPRVGCLASLHFNSRGEGVPLLSFYRSSKIECRHLWTHA